MLIFIAYILSGFIPSVGFILAVNKHYGKTKPTFGDLAFVLFMTCFGVVAMLAYLMLGVALILFHISERDFWKKPLW